MAVFTKTFVQDLKGCMDVHITEGLVFSADNDSNVVSVEIYNGGEAATLTGSVVVYVIRADGNTVVFGGTLSGNTASAVLPQSCFVIPGPIAVMLQIVSGDVRTTVLKAVFTAVASSTGAIIDPGHVIPDISDIIAMLDQMEAATEAANAAATAAGNVNATQSKNGSVITITITDRTGTSTSTTLVDTGSMIAPLEASSTASTAYPAGSYFVLNNTLYRATVDIASGATITPGTNCATATISAGVEEAVDTANEAVTEVQANQITQTASGNPVEITDGADDIPVRQLLVNIVPSQAGEGDPSPTNIRAISGHVSVEVTINGTAYGQFFPAAAGTVYAGTLDVLTGVLTVGYAKETLTSEKPVTVNGSNYYFALGSVPRKSGGVVAYSSHYKCVHPTTTSAFNSESYAFTLSNSQFSSSNGRCFIRDVSQTTVTDLKSYWDAQNLAGTPVQVVYPLASPQTYQLTPLMVKTLLGNNSMSVDCGNLTLTYVVDMKTYIDDNIDEKADESEVATKANASTIGIVCPGTTAPQAITSGQYVIWQGNLYKATANIASGETLSTSSNLEAVPNGGMNALQTQIDAQKPGEWQLVYSATLTEESGINLTADQNGIPFDFDSVWMMFTYPANTPSASTGFGRYYFYADPNSSDFMNAETSKYVTATSRKSKHIYLTHNGNLCILTYTQATLDGSNMSWFVKRGGVRCPYGTIKRIKTAGTDVEPAGTIITIYGQWARH